MHKNLTAQEQRQVAASSAESGVLRGSRGHHAGHTVLQVMQLSESWASPASGGNGKVVGIVTGRDLRFETRYDAPVRDIATPRES